MKRHVELRNHPVELHKFRFRLAVSACFVLVLFLILYVRFYYLQVSQQEHYHTLAEANRISISPLVPNRGLIYDRNGRALAQNYSAYTLEVIPSKIPDLELTLDELATIIEITATDRQRFKKLLKESKRFNSLPIRSRLTDVEIATFAANRYRFPGIEIKARVLRQYPEKEVVSHIIGYISRINDQDLEQLERNEELNNYRGSQHIGKIGIEQSYEKQLHGITGFEEVETDAAGRSIRVLSRTPSIPGNNLILSIDLGLQEAAEKAFGDRRGALVALDPNNGEVLAFVSKPGYDNNLFIGGIDQENWNLLNNSIDRPLNNRALRGVYPPGSTFKPFMALAALELGKRTPEYSMSDPGYFSLPGVERRYRDWKPGGHGRVDLHKSLVVSCDTYYYSLANDLGIDNIHNFIGQFGLGKKTGIDIEGEVSGLLPSSAWKMSQHKQKWYAGDTISVAIGQGYNLTTPLQLAFATMIIANNGKAYLPRLVKQIQNSETGNVEDIPEKLLYSLNLKPKNLEIVKNALVDVTRPGGTAAKAAINASYTFAGKTGTSQVIGIKQGERYNEKSINERHRDHAMFIAYAPAESPKIALAVLVENTGTGGSTAAPIARQVFDYYLLGKFPEAAVAKLNEPAEEPVHDHL
ncbi:MAG: penicillin-binding protein 2 [Nitrosomonas sp.]|jgi:penicillin-binding protein 2|uniref:penicillin-binding protein 2 n=1 Tax=Nitrosomonas sp. TaxID=42353 RepID=UPI00271FF867|nr:penicillin-binding protein 2 [Nitrosomonas sp.]MDO8895368.1 penicillin-binding protein 2 [Nitrosomonas sp.]MDO9471213.1 penicillin-binding protein 2 [Nitrosomonas sp.]MDP1550947.1 penicillin-binding protein 2 [Nitrosomonas sp.]MDP1785970.1 penicillin-binding protein 2 [Nitrosomonas sp.]MDP2225697.1 penicillin-binding protein 2 [Nitrosomonas sp.]